MGGVLQHAGRSAWRKHERQQEKEAVAVSWLVPWTVRQTAESCQLTSLRRGWCVSHAYTHQISGLLSFHLHTDFITLEPTLSHRGNKRRTWKDGLDDGLKADARFQLRWAAARHRADHSAPMTCLSTSSEDAELHSMTERKCSFRCADVSKSCFFFHCVST